MYSRLLSILITVLLSIATPLSNAQSLEDIFNGSDTDSLEADLQGETDFLPIEEAYDLMVMNKDGVIELSWVIADGYYLYGEQFQVKANDEVLSLNIPTGKVEYDEIFEKDVEKHYQFIEIAIPKDQLSTSGKAVNLSVRSQGCADAGLCYPPHIQNYKLSADLSDIQPILSSAVFGSAATDSAAQLDVTGASIPYIRIALTMIAFALLGGVILNLMPCVLPVLSLKALSFVDESQDHKGQGLAYTAGVVTTFLAVALLLIAFRGLGQSIGWGFQLQTPGFVVVLIYLFFIMGLILSGVIQIGGRWMSAGQHLTEGTGYKQSYFTGVLAVVVASPCTAPFMAPALGYALGQPWWVSLVVFLALGFGMALPLLLLSYLPVLSRFLPKPGAWMETFKQFLAFPMYLTAIWLLWLLGRQLGGDQMAWVILGGLLILFVYWLSQHVSRIRPVIHPAVLLVAGLFAWHSHMQPTIEHTTRDLVWETYSPEYLAQLRSQGKPVFLNATADWCITCKANEKLVFTDAMLEDMKNRQIHLLKADWTNYDPEITQLLEKYRRGGVPLYVLYPPSGKEHVLPQILTRGGFKESLEMIVNGEISI